MAPASPGYQDLHVDMRHQMVHPTVRVRCGEHRRARSLVSRSPLGALLDAPFQMASLAVDAAGAVGSGVSDAVGAVAGLVAGVADTADEVVDDVVEAVDDGVDRVELGVAAAGGVVEDVLEEGQDLVEDALGIHRRIWEGENGHVQIEVHGVDRPRAERLRAGLEHALERLDSVRWAEVNAITRRVVVAVEPGVTPVGALVSVVEGIEAAHGVRRARHDDLGWDLADRADHPADVEPIHRSIATITGNTVALGAALAGRLTRFPRLPVELAGIASVIDHVPWARSRAEALFGRRTVDLVLPLLSATANGGAQGPIGIMVDLAHHTSILTELRSRHRVWQRREPHLYADHEAVDPPVLAPRPVPLPGGPVEEWAAWIPAVSAIGALGVFAATRRPRRAADLLLAGVPKAARLGREAFATQLGRTLAARGIVPLDASALRRLDRVDTVVLDSATVLTGRLHVETVVPLAAGEPIDDDTLRSWADRLAATRATEAGEPPARDRWDEPARRNGWSLGAVDGPLPRGAKARATEIRRGGATPLVLRRQDVAVAVVGVVDEIDAATDVLVESVRAVGLRLLVAGRNGRVDERLDHDGTVPAGRAMGAAVRDLQAEGAVVAVIARRGTTGLSAADVGINIARPSGRPSWGGDLLCGPDLAEAVLIVDACRAAAEASRRSAQLAAAGAVLGAIASLTGPAGSAGSRGLTMVNGAAAVATASGTWSAVQLGHRPRVVTVDTTPWHRLDVDEVLRRIESTRRGLSAERVRYRQRSARADEREVGALEPFLTELANPLNPVLVGGAALAALVGSTVDAAMVAALIGVNTLVGGVQRLRTDRTLESLLARSAGTALVVRDGAEIEVAEDDLVRGDVVILRAGDVVPADCRIVEATSLEVDESNLTGESLPVGKSTDSIDADELAERSSMLFEDTTIAAGEARAVVVATGAHTEGSRSLIDATDRSGRSPSGVETRLRELTHQVAPVAGAAAAATAVVGLLRGWPMRDVVGTGVSLAIASVPEGLPFIATAAQLASVRRLGERGAVVRDPRTIEALGRVDLLCFDKTGTLTEGRVALHLVSDGETTDSGSDLGDGRVSVVAAALRASEQSDEPPADLMDRAIVELADETGIGPATDLAEWEAVGALPFEASRGMHVVHGSVSNGHLLSVKGSPEAVLPQCRWMRRGGRRVELDRAGVAELEETVEGWASQGHRVLAVAERRASRRTRLDTDRVRDLELVGFLAFRDPVRATSAEALDRIRASGVEAVMITGDHPTTAGAIAAGLGMLDPVTSSARPADGSPDGSADPTQQRLVLSGQDLERLDDDELDDRIDRIAVFARMTPAQKVRVVRAFQRAGRVVAMTGDGANDAPAIRLADVGVSMGDSGTSAARDAADLIVTDDRLETIIDALAEGRAMWGSVRSAIGILVGGNLGEIGFTVVSSLFSRRASLNARQFLLVNLVTDLAPALAVAVRPPADTTAETLLREGPERSLGAALDRDLAVRALTTTAGATLAWAIARSTGSAGRASTVGLIALVGTQLGQTLAAGSRSPTVIATAFGSALALAAVVQTPVISQFFGCRPVGPVGWSIASGSAVAATLGAVAGQRLVLPKAPSA